MLLSWLMATPVKVSLGAAHSEPEGGNPLFSGREPWPQASQCMLEIMDWRKQQNHVICEKAGIRFWGYCTGHTSQPCLLRWCPWTSQCKTLIIGVNLQTPFFEYENHHPGWPLHRYCSKRHFLVWTISNVQSSHHLVFLFTPGTEYFLLLLQQSQPDISTSLPPSHQTQLPLGSTITRLKSFSKCSFHCKKLS